MEIKNTLTILALISIVAGAASLEAAHTLNRHQVKAHNKVRRASSEKSLEGLQGSDETVMVPSAQVLEAKLREYGFIPAQVQDIIRALGITHARAPQEKTAYHFLTKLEAALQAKYKERYEPKQLSVLVRHVLSGVEEHAKQNNVVIDGLHRQRFLVAPAK